MRGTDALRAVDAHTHTLPRRYTTPAGIDDKSATDRLPQQDPELRQLHEPGGGKEGACDEMAAQEGR